MYAVLRARQPAKIKQHTVHLAGLHQLVQLGMVVEHRAPHFLIPGVGQALVRALHGLGLDVHAQHAAIRSGQTAEEQRIVSIAAGGVEIQPAGGQVRGQKLVTQLHRRQIGHAAAHKAVALRHKVKPARQRAASLVAGQGRSEPGGLLRVKAAAAPQQLLYQIAAVAAPAPLRRDLQPQDRRTVHHGRADDLVFLVQSVVAFFLFDLHINYRRFCSCSGHSLSPCSSPGG